MVDCSGSVCCQSSVCSESTKKEQKNSQSGNVNIAKHWRLICILGLFWGTVEGNYVSTVSRHHFAPDPLCESSSLDSAPDTHAHKLITSAWGIVQFTADFYEVKWRKSCAAFQRCLCNSSACTSPPLSLYVFPLCLHLPHTPAVAWTPSSCYSADGTFFPFCCHIKTSTSNLGTTAQHQGAVMVLCLWVR